MRTKTDAIVNTGERIWDLSQIGAPPRRAASASASRSVTTPAGTRVRRAVQTVQELTISASGIRLSKTPAWAREKLRDAADSLDRRDLEFMEQASDAQKLLFREARQRPAPGARVSQATWGAHRTRTS